MGQAVANRAHYPDLADRGVFVSGGASGIGAAFVAAFAAQACRVTFIDIADAAGARLAARFDPQCVRYTHCDVRDITALRAAIAGAEAAFGPLRVLINNAARDDRHAYADVTPDYWDDNLAINLRHHFFAAQAAAPGMAAVRSSTSAPCRGCAGGRSSPATRHRKPRSMGSRARSRANWAA